MQQDSQIIYRILTTTGKEWQEHNRTHDMTSAKRTADDLYSARKFKQIKIEKQFIDSENGRLVTSTIVTRDGNPSTGVPIYILLFMAVCGGVATFIITLLISNNYL